MNIVTNRLILRKFSDKDYDNYFKILQNRNITKYLGNRKAKNKKEILDILLYFKNNWVNYNYGVWAVTKKYTGELIGQCGYLYVEKSNCPELLYMIDEKYWGNGYAFEAASAVLDFARENYKWKKVIAMIYPENIPSQRIIQKLKFEYIGTIDLYENRLNLYSLSF